MFYKVYYTRIADLPVCRQSQMRVLTALSIPRKV